jgi:putative flippase GtrA
MAGWFAVGVVAVALELGCLMVLYHWIEAPLWIASSVAAETLMLARFFVTDRWVFGHRKASLRRLWRYHAACAGAFVLSWSVLNTSATFFGVPPVIAWVLGTSVALAWSAWTNLKWVWQLTPTAGVPASTALPR